MAYWQDIWDRWQFLWDDRGDGVTYWQWMFSAWGYTVAVAAVSLVVALAIGCLVGTLRTVSQHRVVSALATGWVELFRNIPVLVQLFLWFFVISEIVPGMRGVPSFVLACCALGFFTSARIAEQVRAGIQALPRGQRLSLCDFAADVSHHYSAADQRGDEHRQEFLRRLRRVDSGIDQFRHADAGGNVPRHRSLSGRHRSLHHHRFGDQLVHVQPRKTGARSRPLLARTGSALMPALDFSFYTWANISTYLLSGLYFSVSLTIAATIGGIALGTVIALMRLSGIKPLEYAALWYVNLLRSIPLLMVILWFFLLLPSPFYNLFPGDIRQKYRAEICDLMTFIIYEAAFFSEIVRAGIQSLPRGQTFAGQALGMTYAQNMRYIVLPQAMRNMLPVFLTQTIVLFQDTSLVYAIGAYDILKGFEIMGNTFGRRVETYIMAAVVYFIISFALSMLVKRLNEKIRILR